MNTKQTTMKIILIAAGLLVLFLIGIPFGYGMYHGIKTHSGRTGAIHETLSTHCQCEVDFEFSSVGMHMSKEDGMQGETISFNLENRKTTNSATEEANRLHEILKTEVAGFHEIDLLTLHFVSDNISETVKIENGVVQ